MKGSCKYAFALAASAIFRLGVSAQQSAQREEITPELRLAVARGLERLVRQQLPNGEFDSEHPVATSALVGLAFLAGGHSEKAGGEFTEVIRKGTTALLRRQNSQGYFDDRESMMYGHGFATLYLAELFGTSTFRETEIRAALGKALKVISQSQSAMGGWDYLPARQFGGDEGPRGSADTSITVCQTMALRAARNLGIEVNKKVIDLARSYIENAQKPEGDFRYRDGSNGLGRFLEPSSFPRSAAGTCILYSLGDYNSSKVKLGLDYLYKSYTFPLNNKFPYYGHYYCTQAMFQAGGRYWRDYFPWIRAELLRAQRSDGSWEPRHTSENGTQCTAMALIILQLPYRFLPIHER